MANFLNNATAACAAAVVIFFAPAMNVRAFAQSGAPKSIHDDPAMQLQVNSASDTPEGWAALNQPITARQFAAAEPMPQEVHEITPVQEDPAGPVSTEELRHPLSKKGRSLLLKAQNDSRKGNHDTAIQEFKVALTEKSAEPYAHGMLGIEYLRTHQVAEAISELKKAAAEMPKLGAIHSNLGFALCESGHPDEGLKEFEKALQLDQGLMRARFLRGVILLGRGRHDRETWNDLQIAQKQIPTAHLALAIYYARNGQTTAAQHQLQEYVSLGLGVSVEQAQQWLGIAMSISPAEALGLWSDSSAEPIVGQ